jgi:hypothetical protein
MLESMTINLRAESRLLRLDEEAGDGGSARCIRQARARSDGIEELRNLYFLRDWKQCEDVR